ncbi:MAG: hypothetical protein JOS17DRAFT_732851 [Linnemannia elongata]|nr:MAG: hypothetical protein JOS17DRAFT_732851 [Linnemannia elongata]
MLLLLLLLLDACVYSYQRGGSSSVETFLFSTTLLIFESGSGTVGDLKAKASPHSLPSSPQTIPDLFHARAMLRMKW